MHEEQVRSLKLNTHVIELQGGFYRVPTKIAEFVGNLLNLSKAYPFRAPVCIDSKYEKPTTGIIGERAKMFGESLSVG